MKPPTYEQVDPWARRFNRVSIWACMLGAANSIAMLVTGFSPPPLINLIMVFWWGPIAIVNLILAHIMFRWADARLRAAEQASRAAREQLIRAMNGETFTPPPEDLP